MATLHVLWDRVLADEAQDYGGILEGGSRAEETSIDKRMVIW